nr:DUF551 domain-containing protein [uncultured Flavobacterium sp.]
MKWINVKDGLPKNDAKVQATYLNSHGKRRYIMASYIKKGTVELCDDDDDVSEYIEDADQFFFKEGWYERIENWDEYTHLTVSKGEITHWMPLPEPPTKD